jgi:hypothetical protein
LTLDTVTATGDGTFVLPANLVKKITITKLVLMDSVTAIIEDITSVNITSPILAGNSYSGRLIAPQAIIGDSKYAKLSIENTIAALTGSLVSDTGEIPGSGEQVYIVGNTAISTVPANIPRITVTGRLTLKDNIEMGIPVTVGELKLDDKTYTAMDAAPLTVKKGVSIGGTIAGTGGVILSGTVSGHLTLTGPTTLKGAVTVENVLSVNKDATLKVDGALTVKGVLDLDPSVTLTGEEGSSIILIKSSFVHGGKNCSMAFDGGPGTYKPVDSTSWATGTPDTVSDKYTLVAKYSTAGLKIESAEQTGNVVMIKVNGSIAGGVQGYSLWNDSPTPIADVYGQDPVTGAATDYALITIGGIAGAVENYTQNWASMTYLPLAKYYAMEWPDWGKRITDLETGEVRYTGGLPTGSYETETAVNSHFPAAGGEFTFMLHKGSKDSHIVVQFDGGGGKNAPTGNRVVIDYGGAVWQ